MEPKLRKALQLSVLASVMGRHKRSSERPQQGVDTITAIAIAAIRPNGGIDSINARPTNSEFGQKLVS
jgi:hypothetical protein